MAQEDMQVDSQLMEEDEKVNGAALVFFQNDDRSSLASAFANLAENDQYDAVLTGLCAKILDETSDEKAISSLQDPISLVREMNGRNVEASGRSLMALIDVSAHIYIYVYSCQGLTCLQKSIHHSNNVPCTLLPFLRR